jgi:AraC-like DNA-binding protein
MVSDISATIRHELMHDRQYDSLARDMGVSRTTAKKKFEDWGLIPKEDEPRDKYLGSHIEIDAFGHEFAERLVNELGIDEAEKLAATRDISGMKKVAGKIGLGDNFSEYFEEYPEETFTGRLQKKIRKNLTAFRKEGIY